MVFGPGKLPEVGTAPGETIRNLKKALNDVSSDPTPPAKQQKLGQDKSQQPPEQARGSEA